MKTKMIRGLMINLPDADGIEKSWSVAGIKWEVHSVGCGSADYTFASDGALRKAKTIAGTAVLSEFGGEEEL